MILLDKQFRVYTLDITVGLEIFGTIVEKFLFAAIDFFLARSLAFLEIVPVGLIAKVVEYKRSNNDEAGNPNSSTDKKPNHRLTANTTINESAFMSNKSVPIKTVFTINNGFDVVLYQKLRCERLDKLTVIGSDYESISFTKKLFE